MISRFPYLHAGLAGGIVLLAAFVGEPSVAQITGAGIFAAVYVLCRWESDRSAMMREIMKLAKRVCNATGEKWDFAEQAEKHGLDAKQAAEAFALNTGRDY